MAMTDEELLQIWDKFLERWPLEKMESMTLQDYHTCNTLNGFTSWLESHTEKLGSIWGGSAFKFGIFHRANLEPKQSDSSCTYGEEYAWRTSLGDSPDEAFDKVKKEIIRIITAIRNGDVNAVDSKILWPMVARKIAYLYQDRNNPVMVGVCTREKLLECLGENAKGDEDMASLYEKALAGRGDKNIVTHTREILESKGKDSGIEQNHINSRVTRRGIPLNRILYGPPGTGKTYTAVTMALEIFKTVGMDIGITRVDQLACFEKLRESGHIRFVTFHPSFGYEDFVEGIRAEPRNGQIFYYVKEGVFREICEDATRRVQHLAEGGIHLADRSIWKMSLGNTNKEEDSWVYDYCKANNCLLMGYGGDIDFSMCRNRDDILAKFSLNLPEQLVGSPHAVDQMNNFVLGMKPGDLVIISEGMSRFRAIGIAGENYKVIDNGHDSGVYRQCRDIEWIYFCDPAQNVDAILEKYFTRATLYRLTREQIKIEALARLLESQESENALPYVLIIDEINRGNLAAIFGELITLVETSHRANGSEPLSVTLPYSRDNFSVPGNVYLIGTMNTADRSLTPVDAALRRRFAMIPLNPDPTLLNTPIPSTNISLGEVLQVMNQRIAILLDADHCMGHAPFMHLLEAASSDEFMDGLKSVFADYVAPLLEEYFFDDWDKIVMVLNDQSSPQNMKMLIKQDPEKVFGSTDGAETMASCYTWNRNVFDKPETYVHIVKG